VKVLGIIPARGGSKGVPGKNVRPLLGKPLMGYVIEAALAARRFDRVVISTDADDIAALAHRYDIEAIRRPAEYANDTAPIDLALRHATAEAEKTDGRYDVVVWMQANVPTTRTSVIDEVVDTMLAGNADSVATVCPYDVPVQWAWRLDGDRMVPLEGVYSYTVLRQDQKAAYHLDGAVNAFRRDILMGTAGQPGQAYFGNDRRAVVQKREDSVEIDDEFDLLVAETILRRRHEQAAKYRP
jgi:CMP-N,N'-diacetyllegionaminic acid synthase